MVAELLRFLEGETDPVLDRLETEMAAAADELDYEKAARLRDRLAAVRKAVETQQMVGSRNEDFDVIGLVDDALEAAVQVFFVRRGRVMGRRGFMIDKAEDLDRAELVSRALERLYFDDNPLGWPKLVIVPRHAGRGRSLHRVADRDAGIAGRDPGAAAGFQAGPPGHRHPQR